MKFASTTSQSNLSESLFSSDSKNGFEKNVSGWASCLKMRMCLLKTYAIGLSKCIHKYARSIAR